MERPMAKRNDVTIKVDADVVRDAKLVAVYRGTSVAELISEILRPIVAKMLEEEQAKHSKANRGGKSKAGDR
jgi:hypothetical protein